MLYETAYHVDKLKKYDTSMNNVFLPSTFKSVDKMKFLDIFLVLKII